MKKLDIIFDSDGVLADSHTLILNKYNEEYNDNLQIEDIVSWELDKFSKPGTDILKYFSHRGFFQQPNPIAGAIEIASLLASEGHNLYVATSSPKEGYEDKEIWLQKFFPFIPKKNILMIHSKHLLTADILLDDGLHNLVQTNCRNPIVRDQPWNRKGADGLVRAYDMFDFYRIVQKIKNGYTYEDLLEEQNMKKVI